MNQSLEVSHIITTVCECCGSETATKLELVFCNETKRHYLKDITQLSCTQPKAEGTITLEEYLDRYYKTSKSLTAKSANAFGIPYPLPHGWPKKYANNTAKMCDLTFGLNKSKKLKKKRVI